jgi:DNA repair protein RadC
MAVREHGPLYFQTKLAALVAKWDDHSPENLRRARRLVKKLAPGPEAPASGRRASREQDPDEVEVALAPKKSEALAKSIAHLRELEEKSASARDDREPMGALFHRRLQGLENTPSRVAWIRELLPCLDTLGAIQFMSRIGWPTLTPDKPCQEFLHRLGLLARRGTTNSDYFSACALGEDLAELTKRPLAELDGWIHAFTGSNHGVDGHVALCGRRPHCAPCPLQVFCAYHRHQPTPRASARDEVLPLKQWHASEKPRERLLQHGANSLKDSELLAILLRTGTDGMNVLDLSRKLLEKFGTLRGIEEASLEDLQSFQGIGPWKAVELRAAFELGRRALSTPLQSGDIIRSCEDVFRVYRGRYSDHKQEEFLLLMLNNKNRVIRDEVISRGGLDSSIVHPREVFKAAIRASAAAVIFVHNHPSGNPEPSRDDELVTHRLEEAAKLLQIKVLDHVIIGADSCYSFTQGEVVSMKGKN